MIDLIFVSDVVDNIIGEKILSCGRKKIRINAKKKLKDIIVCIEK